MSDDIEGKVVVVTGASSGIGAEAASHLARLGAKVVLSARRAERLEALATELRRQGHTALAVPADVADCGSVRALVDETARSFGRIDVLINNAGVMPLAPIERLKVDEWDRMVDINFKGVLYGIAAVLPHMQRQMSGHIINVSSVAGLKVIPNGAVYCATKFAVRALSEGLRQEVKPYNIRTTIISPGSVATELLDGISEQDIAAAVRERTEAYALQPDSFARCVAFAISQPEDVDINEIVFRPTRQLI